MGSGLNCRNCGNVVFLAFVEKLQGFDFFVRSVVGGRMVWLNVAINKARGVSFFQCVICSIPKNATAEVSQWDWQNASSGCLSWLISEKCLDVTVRNGWNRNRQIGTEHRWIIVELGNISGFVGVEVWERRAMQGFERWSCVLHLIFCC